MSMRSYTAYNPLDLNSEVNQGLYDGPNSISEHGLVMAEKVGLKQRWNGYAETQ